MAAVSNTIVRNEQKYKIDGYITFPVQLYKRMKSPHDDSPFKFPASAWTVYLTLLSDCEDTGLIQDYRLSNWAKTLGIPYSSLYGGLKLLEKHKMIREVVIENRSYYEIIDYELFRNPEFHNDVNGIKLNYFRVPNILFQTNVLAQFVRTSNTEAIQFMLQLFNQFRVKIGRSGDIELGKLSEEYRMATLKKLLNKKAIDVRGIIEVLKPLFDFQLPKGEWIIKGAKQLWVKKYIIKPHPELFKEKDRFKVDDLMAAHSKELTYFLRDRAMVRYRSNDIRDVMISFKHEVIEKAKYLRDHKQRDQFISDIFFATIDNVEKRIKDMDGTFKFKHSIGAYFRIAYRAIFERFKVSIPYHDWYDAKEDAYMEDPAAAFFGLPD